MWDTPGLGDPFLDDEKQKSLAAELAKSIKDVDHVLYCFDIRRRLEKSDLEELERFSKEAGTNIWKYTTLVLTFANHVAPTDNNEDQLKHLQGLMKSWIETLNKALTKKLKIPEDVVREIPIVPAGYGNMCSPDREEWFSPLWVTAFQRTRPEAQPTMYAISASRMNHNQTEGFSEEQPESPEDKKIFLNANYPVYTVGSGVVDLTTIATATTMGAALGGAAGVIAGPIGIILGAAVGTGSGYIVGAGVVTVRMAIAQVIKQYRKRKQEHTFENMVDSMAHSTVKTPPQGEKIC